MLDALRHKRLARELKTAEARSRHHRALRRCLEVMTAEAYDLFTREQQRLKTETDRSET